jgi:hypothetical protein
MIVTYRHRRKRPAKPAQAATIVVPRLVQITPEGQGVDAAGAARARPGGQCEGEGVL